MFLLGANESHQFSRFSVALVGYDNESKKIFDATKEQVGVLLPFDESSKCHDSFFNTIVEVEEQFMPEVKMSWIPPEKGLECVSLQAKVYHPETDWITKDETLTKIICHYNRNEGQANSVEDSEFDESAVERENGYCYGDIECNMNNENGQENEIINSPSHIHGEL